MIHHDIIQLRLNFSWSKVNTSSRTQAYVGAGMEMPSGLIDEILTQQIPTVAPGGVS